MSDPAPPATPAAKATYHHGDLKAALLAAADALLETDGLGAVSLRAVARVAGVSHAAPAHHFNDLDGLFAELAALGFDRFGAHLAAGRDDPAAPSPMRGIGLAYVDFALRFPQMFLLMFRGRRLDRERPALAASRAQAFAVLAGQTGGDRGRPESVAAWSLVHGLAMLLLDGRLPPEAGQTEMVSDVLSRLRGVA